MTKIICPVENCQGSETSSGRPNVLNHIKNLAKTELLHHYILGEGKRDHAEYLKKNAHMETKTIFRIGNQTMILDK